MAKAALTATALAVAVLLAARACDHHHATVTCARTIDGIERYLVPGELAWFGELHGTAQSPAFVGDAACRAAQVGRGPIQVALEIPDSDQAGIDRFVAGGGGEQATRELLAGPFWAIHDGRSSEAMLALVERVRALRAAGAPISIIAYDRARYAPDADRDAEMAAQLAAHRDPRAIVIGLSGNIHSRRTRFGTIEPMVAHLVTAGLTVTTFDVAANGGSFWACTPACGEHPYGGKEPGTPWTLGPARDPSHDGVYRVGALVASPPARP